MAGSHFSEKGFSKNFHYHGQVQTCLDAAGRPLHILHNNVKGVDTQVLKREMGNEMQTLHKQMASITNSKQISEFMYLQRTQCVIPNKENTLYT